MTTWILEIISSAGYFGLFFLMVLENLFPPIPSEVIVPFAGFAAARGELALPGVIVAGTLGSVAGTMPWYYLGKWFGVARMKALAARFGRLMTVTPGEVDQAVTWFNTYGLVAVLTGRLVPAIRTLISIPAGIAAMPLGVYLLYSTIGSAIWVSLLAIGGYVLGQQEELIAQWMDPVGNVVIAACVIVYVVRVIRFKPE